MGVKITGFEIRWVWGMYKCPRGDVVRISWKKSRLEIHIWDSEAVVHIPIMLDSPGKES